jgi:PAS domain S-box-containing protein
VNEKPFDHTLDLLNSILREFNTPQLLNDALQGAIRKLAEAASFRHATLALLDERSQFFLVKTEYPPSNPSLVGERITIGNRPNQLKLLNAHTPIVADLVANRPDLMEDPSFRQIVVRLDIRSMLVVPVVFNGRTLGTIGLDAIGGEVRFGREEIAFCEAVASHVGLAIENGRMLEQQAKYKRQAELLFSVPSARLPLHHTEKASDQLFQRLKTVIEFKKGSVQLIFEGKRTLAAAFGFQKENSDPWLLRPIDVDPIMRQIATRQKITVVPYTDRYENWAKQDATFDVNSWIGMPLVFEGETYGLVTLDHDEAGKYECLTAGVMNQLEDIASQAGLEIHTAHELDASQRKVQALEVIGGIADQVATKLDKDVLLPAIASAVSEATECTCCTIFLLERGKESLRWICEAAFPEPTSLIGSLDVNACPIFQTGKPEVIQDLRTEKDCGLPDEIVHNFRSMAVVPLKVADQTIGVVAAFHEQRDWFSPADQLLLAALTRYASIAIERGVGLELVHSVGADILKADGTATVLEKIVKGAMTLIHSDSGVIYLLNDRQTEVIDSFKVAGSIHPTPRLDNPNGITREVISQKQMVVIPDIAGDPRINPELLRQYRSMVAVPLAVNESVIGVLYLNGVKVRRLTATEKSLLYTLADQAALVIRMKNSEAMYHSLVDNVPQCVFRKDAHSRFVSANESFCSSLGKTLDQILGKDDYAFYRADMAAKYVADDQRVMQTGKFEDITEEHQLIGSDQSKWVRVVKTAVKDANGKVVGVQAIFWDITSSKQLEERWQSLVEQSPDSIVVHENEKITLANPAAVRLFGAASKDELYGRSILEFVDARYRDEARRRLEHLNRKEPVDKVAMKIRRKNGERINVEVYARSGPSENEAQVVFHDLTMLREMHHRVKRSLYEIEGLLTRQEEFNNDARVRHVFKSIRSRIQAMALVYRILFDTLRESDVDMKSYLEELIKTVFDAYMAADARIERHMAVDDVELDERRATACGLIANELVSNSLLHAFSNGRGRIDVSLALEDGGYLFRVTDNGDGMLPASRGRRDSMGLSLVDALVDDELRGKLTRPKTALGTFVEIRFPRVRTISEE